MKRFLFAATLSALALASVQCSNDRMEELEPDEPTSRSIYPIDESETNPDLLTNWESCTTVKLNELGPNGKNKEVTLPWRNGAPTSLNSKFCEDIKSADGWSMIFHTFCKSNTDVGLSYMCFYNKFTGYLKVFYCSPESEKGTKTLWHLSSADGHTPQPLFSDLEFFSQPIEGDDNYTVWSATANNMINSDISVLYNGWNGFEFRVGEYHPVISTEKLHINAYATAYTQLSIDGVTNSTIEGTITATNSTESSAGKAVNAVANLGYKKVSEALNKYAEKHEGKKFIGINIADIANAFASGNIVSAFTAGLGCIFKGLVKNEPSVEEVKLQSNGTVKLQGIADTQFPSVATTLSFDLTEILNANKPTVVDSAIYGPGLPINPPIGPIRPTYFATSPNIINPLLQSTKLGVWNLKKKPTIYYERYSRFHNHAGLPDKNTFSGVLYFHGIADVPNTHIDDIELEFNPNIKRYIKSYSVRVAMIDVEGGNRSLDNRRKHLIALNRNNLIKTDSAQNLKVYGVTYDQFPTSGSLDCDQSPKVELNNGTEFYIDWGENVGGNRAAVVTLTMNIEYNGKQTSVTESRVYDVIYKPDPDFTLDFDVNNPPYTYVINQPGNFVYGFDLPTGK